MAEVDGGSLATAFKCAVTDLIWTWGSFVWKFSDGVPYFSWGEKDGFVGGRSV